MSFIIKITSGSMILSDPSHPIGIWCAADIPARNGNWNVVVIPGRNIIAWHIESAIERLSLPMEIRSAGFLPYTFTVPTLLFGYFDKESFIKELPVMPTLVPYHILPNGVLVSTNGADLQTRGIKDAEGRVIALATSFIPEVVVETEDEDDNDEETEEEVLD